MQLAAALSSSADLQEYVHPISVFCTKAVPIQAVEPYPPIMAGATGGISGTLSRRVERSTTAVGTAAASAGVVHLALARDHLHESLLVGAGFLVSGAALSIAGLALSVSGKRRAWIGTGTAACLTALAYVASRTVGLPGAAREAWDAVGVVTTMLEGAVAVVSFWAVRPRRPLRFIVPIISGLLAAPAIAVSAIPSTNAPAHCVIPTRAMTLYAEELAPASDGRPRLGYGTSPTNASTPGPLIQLTEGDCMAVTLVNHVSAATLQRIRDGGGWPSDPELPLGVSLHVHGVKYTPQSDGTLHTGSYVPPGQARTYLWYAAPRVTAAGRVVSPGTAGYWWYHDHVAGTAHGTGGINSGLFGGLIVRRLGDPAPDRTYVVAMGGPAPLINFRSYPATFACDSNGNTPGPDCFVATLGQRVEFLVIGVPGTIAGEDMHEFHLHGHVWADNRTGLLTSASDDTRVIDAKSIGPSESWGFQVIAGDEVGTGDWMLHCHIQAHSDRGMLTFFRVLLGDGTYVAPVSAGSAAHVHGGH
jgi:FtsP/CotA-like multicopper oxidase with cupredoxin domain